MKTIKSSAVITNLHAHFVASRLKHVVHLHSKFHPQVELTYSIVELELLRLKRMKKESFFQMINALTHALDGSITSGAEKLDIIFSSYGDQAIQLRVESRGKLSDPSICEMQCLRLTHIESLVEKLGGEVACLYEPNRMQFDMVFPFAEPVQYEH